MIADSGAFNNNNNNRQTKDVCEFNEAAASLRMSAGPDVEEHRRYVGV